MRIEEHISLAPLTTFRIGGAARFFVHAVSVQELQEALVFAHEKNLPVFIFGSGSNVLVPDEGFDGLVIKIELRGIELRHEQEKTLLIAEAGELWDDVVARAVAENLWGIENLSGIPGTVGGAIVQNIGAYGAAVSEHLLWVEVYDSGSGAVRQMTNAECLFEYRDSFFKHDDGRHVVLRAAFVLSTIPMPNISYRDIASRMQGKTPTLPVLRDTVLSIREGKFPDLFVEGTAGSFFKNPIVTTAEAEGLAKRFPEMPLFTMPETAGIKIPLAWILDKELAMRGFAVGGARLFESQPLVIAARFGTPASDVYELAMLVREKIHAACGITIESEVNIVESKNKKEKTEK